MKRINKDKFFKGKLEDFQKFSGYFEDFILILKMDFSYQKPILEDDC